MYKIIRILRLLPHVAYYKNIRVQCAKEQTDVHCYGYSAWDPVEKAIIIVFIGVSSELQGLDLEYSSLLQKKIAFFDNGRLIKYFNDAFMFLWNGGLEQQVRTLKYQYPDYKIYVTGHSMGASIATVAASYILKWGMWAPKDLRLITYGEPRTGDYDFAAWHDATFLYSYRVISHHDPIPHSPPRFGADMAFHNRYEVWYDNDMAVGQPYTICQEADGDYCSNTVSNHDGSDHLFYFNMNIKEWGLNGCPPGNLTLSKWCPETKTCEEKTTNCTTPITLVLNCPRQPDPAYAYNDTFARYYITPLISGLFLDTPESCLKQKVAFFDDGHLYKYFNDAFFFLWDGGLEQQIHTLKYQYPDYKIYVSY
ncbi:unnamed protein product [Strongylus vulgaris]|uniref:Fungal lipase-type domain-containing protein n=1 Tax=Strongylus vulgaris TaxID=40348 RepID=A0A3P7LC26_STRVU|nr:unnamed protein product [Strongylus vulgaris]